MWAACICLHYDPQLQQQGMNMSRRVPGGREPV